LSYGVRDTSGAALPLERRSLRGLAVSLFKYVHEDRIDILENGLIRFTQPATFNDPFEMSPCITSLMPDGESDTFFESEWKPQLRKAYEALPFEKRELLPYPQFQQLMSEEKQQLGTTYKRWSQMAGPLLSQILPEKLNEAIGVLSLTSKPDNLLMWAHYANSHQGFVIEFDETHPFFNQRRTETDELRYLRKVNYAMERPLTAMTDEAIGIDVFCTKSQEWQYEQEWRMMVALDDCTKKIAVAPNALYLFALPPECVTGIILGCRTTSATKTRVVELLRSDSRYRHLNMRDAVTHAARFALRFRDL
jgi:Protein of unknown function (DUF2971)